MLSEEAVDCFVHSDQKLSADGTADQKPDLLFIKFPGTGGRAEKSTTAPKDYLPPNSFAVVEVWTWNPPGYGASEGRATLSRIGDAAVEMARQVINLRTDTATTVWLVGNSLGCIGALNVARNFGADGVGKEDSVRPAGMILRNPPQLDLIVKRIATRYPLGSLMDPVADSLPACMNAIQSARGTQIPTVFLESELDSLVLPAEQSQVRSAHTGPQHTVVMKGIGHDGIAEDTHLPPIKEAVQWLYQQTRTNVQSEQQR